MNGHILVLALVVLGVARVAVAAPPEPPAQLSGQELLTAQVALDRLHLSPGCLDGRNGSRTRLAVATWQEINRFRITGALTRGQYAQLTAGLEPLTRCTVTEADYEGLSVPAPQTWREKAAATQLGHATIQEAMAERFHAAEALIVQLNPQAEWPNPPPGTDLVVPRVQPGDLPPAARLEVSVAHKWIRAYDADGYLLAHFPCSIAADKAKRPAGSAQVVAIAPNPNYTFDPALFPESPEAQTITSKLMIPPGPNNPVGTAWIGLSLSGYGIHGTPWPEDIGKTESHGCFRLANWNAALLLRALRPGVPVSFGNAGSTAAP